MVLMVYIIFYCVIVNWCHFVWSETDDPIKVMFVGDSLLNRPIKEQGLVFKLRKLLPFDYKNDSRLIFMSAAADGSTILDIRQKQLSVALSKMPDMIIMFWDSDCSNYNEMTMASEEVSIQHKNYRENLKIVVETILSHQIHLVMTGPGFLGEGWLKLGLPARFQGKEKMLETYLQINKRVARSHNATFINIRRIFQRSIPWYWIIYKGYFTVDGEHLNEHGVNVAAKIFAKAINDFLIARSRVAGK